MAGGERARKSGRDKKDLRRSCRATKAKVRTFNLILRLGKPSESFWKIPVVVIWRMG